MSELQEKIYKRLEQLQRMTSEISADLQQRIPNELLSGLATSMEGGPIFEIVKSLTEVQHATEKQLFRQRLQIQRGHSQQKLDFQSKYQDTICDINDPSEVLKMTGTLDELRKKMEAKQDDDLKQIDMKIIMKLDQQTMDQQSTLEKAGVPGFYVTNDSTNIKVQMHLLKCISKLGKESI